MGSRVCTAYRPINNTVPSNYCASSRSLRGNFFTPDRVAAGGRPGQQRSLRRFVERTVRESRIVTNPQEVLLEDRLQEEIGYKLPGAIRKAYDSNLPVTQDDAAS
eukprot:GHVU01058193.1.p1 GENE.GHVU01058193.1~~GHVU01058193.1.p1  ORF type:complete len:105 (+),score=4.18 GHVU01058193.1:58-372(+)